MGAIRTAMLVSAALILVAPVARARQLTDANYSRAVQFLGQNTTPLVDHDVQHVKWLDGTHFWYVDHDASGDHVMEMNAVTGKISAAFDQVKLAAALSMASGKKINPAHWPAPFGFRSSFNFQWLANGQLDVEFGGATYRCDLAAAGSCVNLSKQLQAGSEPGAMSPNGKQLAFVRNWNLWVRNVATGKETQLTSDGVRNFGYGTQNAGWIHGNGLIIRWSPDSTKIATYLQDQRGIPYMYTIRTGVGHPVLDAWPEPLPGDKKVFMIEPVVMDVATKHMVHLQMPSEERLSTLCDSLACDQGSPYKWADLKWAPDSQTLATVVTSRNRQHETFLVANAETGAVRTAFEWTAKDYYESGHDHVNWEYLPETDEAIWPTWQNNWDNLYLYSLKTGKMLHPITTGKGNVDIVTYIDRKSRTLWYIGVGRTPGMNPYYHQLWKVNIDTGKTELLTPEDADHTITMSPNDKYFVDSYSTINTPPVTVLRSSSNGHIIATITRANIFRLKAMGWVPPTVFTVKGRDGKTTLYGLMFKPTNFDPAKKYPVVDYIYPGPQSGSIHTFGFTPAVGDDQALAELGFVVVAINGMGTPDRSASFHHLWYGNVEDNTLPDQVAGIKELAERYPWIDIDRVGIWGHSGGGNATVAAMFKYPNFFKVGWSESGNDDFRNYENPWGEKYQGLLTKYGNGTTNYDSQANELFAKNLEGHLMLVHGAVDPNVPHSLTYLVVDALIRANKNFDMLILPDEQHGYANDSPYVMRRRWDYFVRYLAGDTPPHEFYIAPPPGSPLPGSVGQPAPEVPANLHLGPCATRYLCGVQNFR